MHSVIHWCANDKEQRSHITLTDNISSWTCQWIETWHHLEYLHCHEMRSLDASLSNSNVCLLGKEICAIWVCVPWSETLFGMRDG